MKPWLRNTLLGAFMLMIAVVMAAIIDTVFRETFGTGSELSSLASSTLYVLRILLSGWLTMVIGCWALARLDKRNPLTIPSTDRIYP